mgnify:CR=1 FL=1
MLSGDEGERRSQEQAGGEPQRPGGVFEVPVRASVGMRQEAQDQQGRS